MDLKVERESQFNTAGGSEPKSLRQVWLVLGLVTTFCESTIPVFIQATQAHSAWPSLRR